MNRHRQVVEALLARAGVAIGGTNRWDIAVNDERSWTRTINTAAPPSKTPAIRISRSRAHPSCRFRQGLYKF